MNLEDKHINLEKLIEKRDIFQLCTALNHDNFEVRIAAVRALGEIGDELAITPIINLLKKDPIAEVRSNAVIALNKFDNPTMIIEPLLEALNDGDNEVQRNAINGLIKLEDYALKPLLDNLNDKRWQIRAVSAEILGKIGNPLAEPYLRKMLIEPNMDKTPYVRGKVAEALGELGEESSIPVLQEALNDNHFIVCNKATEALELIELMNELCSYETPNFRFDFPCKLKIKEIYDKNTILIAYLKEVNLKISYNIIENSADIEITDFINIMNELFEQEGLNNIKQEKDKISKKSAIFIKGYNHKNDIMVEVISFKHNESIHYIRTSINISCERDFKKYLRIMKNSFTLI